MKAVGLSGCRLVSMLQPWPRQPFVSPTGPGHTGIKLTSCPSLAPDATHTVVVQPQTLHTAALKVQMGHC